MSEEIGPTCLYKNGTHEIFEGEDVELALEDGWRDKPTPAIDDDVIDVPVKKKRAKK